MTAHDWADDGELEYGGRRIRCVACGMCRHWDAVPRECSPYVAHDVTPADAWEAAKLARTRRKREMAEARRQAALERAARRQVSP